VTQKFPTANFASLLYGPAGVEIDDPAEAYHEASRLYPAIAPPRLELLTELPRSPELGQTAARSSRTHDHRPSVELPPPVPLRGSLRDAITRRRSARGELSRPLRLAQLAAVLASCYAAESRGDDGVRRPIPSAGALYPLELYIFAIAVAGLDRGVYHYQPFRGRLSLLAPLVRVELEAAFPDPEILDRASAVLVVTAMFWRSRFKYGPRGYRFALLEAGHLMGNAVLVAAELDLAALPVGGFYDRRLDRLVGAEGLDEATLYALVLGGEQ
jgi:SagB-type dehydrogenase family enzyme